jgi:HSP20 family molecular chaperone IbpA
MTLYVTRPMHRHAVRHMMRDLPLVEAELVFPIDIAVKEDAYHLTALLPGVTPDDLDIQIKDNVISIKGEIRT